MEAKNSAKKKITLRPVEENDSEFVYEMMKDKEYQKHYLERLTPKNLNETKNEIKKAVQNRERKFAYYFIIQKGKERVGILDVYKIMEKDKRASIGYGIARKYWGKGIATKACELGVEFIKKELNLHSVEATADPNNKASCAVLEKNEFERIGVIKDYYFDKGKYIDRALYWKIL